MENKSEIWKIFLLSSTEVCIVDNNGLALHCDYIIEAETIYCSALIGTFQINLHLTHPQHGFGMHMLKRKSKFF